MQKITCLRFAAKYSGKAAGWQVGTSNEKILLVILPLNAGRRVNLTLSPQGGSGS